MPENIWKRRYGLLVVLALLLGAVILAALASLRNHTVPRDTVTFGEIGLGGEIRPVPFGEERIREASKHGFRRAIVPRTNVPRSPVDGIEIVPVSRLTQAIDALA